MRIIKRIKIWLVLQYRIKVLQIRYKKITTIEIALLKSGVGHRLANSIAKLSGVASAATVTLDEAAKILTGMKLNTEAKTKLNGYYGHSRSNK